MKAKKFELFMCCLGNGTTLCNKAVTEHGDYKTIGHISNRGHIKLYVSYDYIPVEDMQKIQKVADMNRCKFLENWNSLPDSVKYQKLLDGLPLNIIHPYLVDKSKTMEQTINELTEIYLNWH